MRAKPMMYRGLLINTTTIQRFHRRMIKRKPDECWGWIGSHSDTGYGNMMCCRGKCINAHKLSWVIHIGEVPKGKCVLHKCDNRGCVNPKHLFLGTIADNNRDCLEKGRHLGPRGTQVFSAKLDERKVVEILSLYDNVEYKYGMINALARQFRVNRITISHIIHRRMWKWVEFSSNTKEPR